MIDYEVILMLPVRAIQALLKRLESLEKDNVQHSLDSHRLETRLKNMEALFSPIFLRPKKWPLKKYPDSYMECLFERLALQYFFLIIP